MSKTIAKPVTPVQAAQRLERILTNNYAVASVAVITRTKAVLTVQSAHSRTHAQMLRAAHTLSEGIQVPYVYGGDGEVSTVVFGPTDVRGVELRWAGSMLGWMPVDAEYFVGVK